MIMNLVNNAVASYGLKPVLGGAVLVGILCYPTIKLITELALDILQKAYKWACNSTVIIRLRSIGCDQCAVHHRVHMSAMDLVHRTHGRRALDR